MAKTNLLNTNTVNLIDLLGNSKTYRVPLYQRDYSWREEHWEDLWEDILEMKTDPEARHYMGSVVLQSTGENDYLIIDGQQRFTTLSLITIGIIKKIQELVESGKDAKANQERVTILRRSFLGDKDPTSLLYSSKLFLNTNNDNFYQSYVLQLRRPPNVHRLTESEQLLWRAYQYYLDRLTRLKDLKDGESLASFLTKTVARQLLFIQIVVEDELSAYTVFETLNARGIGLTSTDLLKNYLFSLIKSRSDLDHVGAQWSRIAQLVGAKNFPEFLRYFVNARQPMIRAERLFKTLKSNVVAGDQVLSLLDDLELNADLYKGFRNPSHEIWRQTPERRRYIRILRLFRVSQLFPLLLSAYHKFEDADFTRLLKLCVVMTFRYTIISRLNTNELEKAYNQTAYQIFKGEVKTPRQVFESLRTIYVSDEKFIGDFTYKSLNTRSRKKLVRYILFTLEEAFSGQAPRDFEDDPGAIEHILPESPGEVWSHAFPVDIQWSYLYRLGNLTLLREKPNRRIGNKAYREKKALYLESEYALTQAIIYEDWTREELNRRQEAMAQKAVQIWRADF